MEIVALNACHISEEKTYQIVGEDESDVAAGKISLVSPIARAIIGKHEGDEVVVKAPAGDLEYEIQSVAHI